MNEERKKILDLLAQGKITVEEADRLLTAVSSPETEERPVSSAGSGYKYLRVFVEPGPNSQKQERVNIRVPLKLIRAGLKWAAFVPQHVQGEVDKALREKGIDLDFSKIRPEDLEEIVTQLNDLTVEVEGKEKVRVFCE
jgi:hypothetical protein